VKNKNNMAKLQSAKKRIKYANKSVFLSAGTPNYIGKEVKGESLIKLVTYNTKELAVYNNVEINDLNNIPNLDYVNWIEVSGVHQIDIISKIEKKFHLHPLLIEDILNTTQKPKIEYFEKENHLFFVLKVPRIIEDTFEIENEHIALILGNGYVISFQELDTNNVFDFIIKRLNRENSKTRRHKADYLFYSLIDLVVDNYFLVLSKLEEKLSDLEDQILFNAKPEHQNQLFFLKREITFMKKTILPLKDIINQIIRDPFELISNEVKVYIRDIMDHVVENLETIETFKDDIENLLVNYHSQLSNKMNAVMKTLTVFTAIFMPLTFIVGIYGMNFDNMPELRNTNGYFYTLIGMTLLAALLWIYFKWKKYL
jgi:magnesium transporter